MGSGADSLAGGAVPDPDFGGSLDSDDSPSFGAEGADLSPPASSTVNDSKAETSSPSSTRTAIGCTLLVYYTSLKPSIEFSARQSRLFIHDLNWIGA